MTMSTTEAKKQPIGACDPLIHDLSRIIVQILALSISNGRGVIPDKMTLSPVKETLLRRDPTDGPALIPRLVGPERCDVPTPRPVR